MSNSFLLKQVLLKFTDSFKEHRKDISAVILTPEQHLWLGSDETSTIERLSLIDSNTFAEHKHFAVADFIELPAPPEEEIDIEGFAYNAPYLWFIGSHSWKRKKPKPDRNDEKNIDRLTKLKSEPNRYIIGRIPLINRELRKSCLHPDNSSEMLSAAKLETTNQGNLLMDALGDDEHLGVYVKATIPGKENGFDIEGIAVYQNKLFLGLRGPVLRGWAVILEVELEPSSAELLKLKSSDKGQLYKKHFIYLNGLGIRDICPDREDLLILAGPTMDLDGPVRVYKLANGVNISENVLSKPEIIKEIPSGNGDDRAEGMTLLTDCSKTRSLLVVYDSPAEARLQGDSDVVADVFNLD